MRENFYGQSHLIIPKERNLLLLKFGLIPFPFLHVFGLRKIGKICVKTFIDFVRYFMISFAFSFVLFIDSCLILGFFFSAVDPGLCGWHGSFLWHFGL